MFVTNTLNGLADYIGIMHLKIGLYALCAQHMLMDRNACVIPIINDKKNALIMQHRNQNILKHFLISKITSGDDPPPPPSGAVEYFGYHTQTLGYCFFKLDWKALCTGGYKLNPFALPHSVVARARRLELRRTVKVQPMALHDAL